MLSNIKNIISNKRSLCCTIWFCFLNSIPHVDQAENFPYEQRTTASVTEPTWLPGSYEEALYRKGEKRMSLILFVFNLSRGKRKRLFGWATGNEHFGDGLSLWTGFPESCLKISLFALYRHATVLSWKFPPRPLSMLEIPTQSMDTNFYPNIELGGRGNFFQHLRPRL